MKQHLIIFVAILTVLSVFSCLTLSGCAKKENGGSTEESGSSADSGAAAVIREAFETDFKESYSLADDGVLGIPVKLDAYARSSVVAHGAGILYVVGSGAVRAGTESDVSIIEDLLAKDYIVTVLDYMGNPAAERGINLDQSVHKIYMDFIDGKYMGNDMVSNARCYVLPAGCRIDLGVYYYSLDTMAPYGTVEYIVDTYNLYYAMKKKDAFGNPLPLAVSVKDCLKKDLTPINTDLVMDIIYPSNPEITVPCFALASSSETYYQSISNPVRPYMTAALLDGYAGIVYEHEYIPMSRNDHFGYNDSRFTLSYYAALHTHSAAVRRIRYLADTYGYDAEYLSMFGFSKSGYGPALLMDDNRWEKGEFYTLDQYVPKGTDTKKSPSEQPWLTYEGTNTPIDEKPTVVYVGSGWAVHQARNFCIRDGVGPLMASIGELDETANISNQIPYAVKKFAETDGELYFLTLPNTKHNPPAGYDEDREADLFEVTWTFLDNHVRAAYREEPPTVLWMTPKDNTVFATVNAALEINFSRAMNSASVKDGVEVIRLSDNQPISGTWENAHGLTYTFRSSEFSKGESYRVTVTEKCKAADGVGIASPVTKSFSIAAE